MEETNISEPVSIQKPSIIIPNDFNHLISQRLHIEFERADLQNNVNKLEYFYEHHKEFCEYYMRVTDVLYDWKNYHAFINSKMN